MKVRMLCALLTIAVSTGAIYSPRASAAFVTTEALLKAAQPSTALPSTVHTRDALRARLVALGVDPALAQERVSAITDEEVARLAALMDRLPAGGDAVGAVIFVFLVLLVTDILGYTDVYPFITRTVNGDKCTDRAETTPRPLARAAR